MRALEYFHAMRVLPDTWLILRVDGRSFSRLTQERFEKPFDERFRDLMIETTQTLTRELHALYAYTESDEISVLFPPAWNAFDRELEKLVSVSAGIASAAFTAAFGKPAHFDARVWVSANPDAVVDYFQWRQSDAARCGLNGWVYWTLRSAGSNVRAATAQMERQSTAAKNELLFQNGINFNELPKWQRRGLGVYWQTYEKVGFNPVSNQPVTTTRRRLYVDLELPMKAEYANFVRGILEGAAKEDGR